MSESFEQTIAVEGLHKWYGDVQALKGIDFEVEAGEIVGFLGPNGAGKTTTMKILTCFMAASDGEATVAGHDVQSESKQVRRKIGYLPENVPLYDEMLVCDYLNFVAEIQGITRSDRSGRIEEVGEMTGVDPVMGKAIRELSKGFRQRVGLAQAIIHEPEVIFLDEPTTGLDPNQIIEIRDVITSIGREKTVILSTHILQEVSAVCDRIIIIDDGLLVADGAIEALQKEVADSAPECFEDTVPTLEDIFRWFTAENGADDEGRKDNEARKEDDDHSDAQALAEEKSDTEPASVTSEL